MATRLRTFLAVSDGPACRKKAVVVGMLEVHPSRLRSPIAHMPVSHPSMNNMRLVKWAAAARILRYRVAPVVLLILRVLILLLWLIWRRSSRRIRWSCYLASLAKSARGTSRLNSIHRYSSLFELVTDRSYFSRQVVLLQRILDLAWHSLAERRTARLPFWVIDNRYPNQLFPNHHPYHDRHSSRHFSLPLSVAFNNTASTKCFFFISQFSLLICMGFLSLYLFEFVAFFPPRRASGLHAFFPCSKFFINQWHTFWRITPPTFSMMSSGHPHTFCCSCGARFFLPSSSLSLSTYTQFAVCHQ